MTKPRVGFLGVGWIGRDRLTSIQADGAVEAAALVDCSPECVAAALAIAPRARVCASLDEMLGLGLDGVVIATPSAQHAEQAIAALEAGAAVFCQKPLGRGGDEVAAVIAAAKRADRLLAVDLSYRHTAAAGAVKRLVEEAALGRIFAADLTFHNAYGPDKAWFYDREQSGGGCVIDLGVHLVDLALWLLGFPAVERVTSRLRAKGEALAPGSGEVEDHAIAELELAGGITIRLACSWRLHAGVDAAIEATLHGTHGAASVRNVNGSFYDFEALRFAGTSRRVLVAPPDAWGGRSAVAWAARLANDRGFDPAAARGFAVVADALDRIYAGA